MLSPNLQGGAGEAPNEGLVVTSKSACHLAVWIRVPESQFKISASPRIYMLSQEPDSSTSRNFLDSEKLNFRQLSIFFCSFPPNVRSKLEGGQKDLQKGNRCLCSFHNRRAGWIWKNNNSVQDTPKPPQGFQALSCFLRLLYFFP